MNQFGITINYQPNGSSSGRTFFAGGQADWAASEIPYGVVDGANTDPPPVRGFVYMPDVAGGTTLMYNLQINGQRVTNLRLSGNTVADIFTNKITKWNDPEIAADNPGLTLPAPRDHPGGPLRRLGRHRGLHPVDARHRCPGLAGVLRSGRPDPVHADLDVPDPGRDSHDRPARRPRRRRPTWRRPRRTGRSATWSTPGRCRRASRSRSCSTRPATTPCPSPGHVAVSLLQDQINTDASNPATYLTQNLSGVYTNTDPRNYELSAYSYLILPTDPTNGMTTAKGYTIGTFGNYALCLGQSQVDVLGYSALPINLVQDGFTQLAKIPGRDPTERTPASPSATTRRSPPTAPTRWPLTTRSRWPATSRAAPSARKAWRSPPRPASTRLAPAGTGRHDEHERDVDRRDVGRRDRAPVAHPVPAVDRQHRRHVGYRRDVGHGRHVEYRRQSSTGGAQVTSPTGGATSGSTGTTGSGQNCDPNTGVCTTPAATTGTGSGATGERPAPAHRHTAATARSAAARRARWRVRPVGRRHPDHARGQQRQRPRGHADGPRGRNVVPDQRGAAAAGAGGQAQPTASRDRRVLRR